MSRAEQDEARLAHEVTARAIRRLDWLEWVTLAGAAVVAVAGGFVVALVLEASAGLAFRPSWMVAALLLLGGPGAIVMIRRRREDRHAQRKKSNG